MRTNVQTIDGVTVVEIEGYMDFETAFTLSRSIDEIYKKDSEARLIINLRGLEFVGSSGISNFIKNMRSHNALRMKPSYCGVRGEFLRLFRAFEDAHPFEVVETVDEARRLAKDRFDEWQAKTLRSKRTH